MEFLQLSEGNLEEEQVNDTSTDNIKTNTRVKNAKYQICLKVACLFLISQTFKCFDLHLPRQMTRVAIWQGISHNCYGCFPRGLIKINNIYSLRHWGRLAHICVCILSIIGLDNGLSPGRCQPIIWTNTGKLLMGSLGKKLQWKFNQNSYIFIIKNAFENIVWKMAAILSQCLNVLRSRTHTSWMIICLEQRLLCE